MPPEVSGNNDSPKLLSDSDGNNISAQFPLQVDGDSVYSKDVDPDLSSTGTFTGDILTLFNDYETEITDTGATNPKIITIHLFRPIKTNQIGIGSKTGNFSNVKISLKDLSGTVRSVVDDSASNTKHTSNVYSFTTNVFIEAVIEFYTADPVAISGMYIPKVQSRAISAIDGYESDTNTTLDPLLANTVFVGGQIDTLNYGIGQLAIFSDVPSATLGLKFQFRSTPTSTWYDGNSYTYLATSDKPYSEQMSRRFMRVIYTNGGVDQSVFDMQVILKPVYVKPSSHEVGKNISSHDDAELVISVLKAENPDGDYPSIGATASDNLKIANAEDNLNIAQGNVVGYDSEHKFGRGANIDTADGMVVLWDGAEYNDALKVYTYSPDNTADIDRISSSNNSDTEPIEIKGLDVNGDLVVQTIILTGQTPVPLTTSLWRVFRNENVGASDLLGTMFCFVNVATTLGVPDTLTNIRSLINIGNNQTLMCLYTVPNATTGYIISWYGALSSAKAASFNNLEMRARPFGSVFKLKHTSTLSSAGSSHIQHGFAIPQGFPAKTDFVMFSDSSVNDNAVSAGFDFVLIDD